MMDEVRGWGTDAIVPDEVFDVALLDLDGVVYVGECAVGHAVASISAARQRGMRPAYVTNNASRTPTDVAAHLRDLGLDVEDADVVTSAQAGAHALQRLLLDRGESGPILAVGGPGVAAAVHERGLEAIVSADQNPVAVLQGFGRDIGWPELVEASVAVGRGIPWVATNPDVSIPTPRGRAPGNGAFVHAVGLATGRTPDLVAGKPHRPLIDESLERTGAARALMIGDRLDTDIEAGVTSGLPTLLVMTGVTDVVDVLLAHPRQRPDLVSLDLRGLHQASWPVVEEGGRHRCGPITVEIGPHVSDLQVTGLPTTGAGTGDALDVSTISDPVMWSGLMRATAAAVWQWRDEPDGAHESGGEHRDEVFASQVATLPVVKALQVRVEQARLLTGR